MPDPVFPMELTDINGIGPATEEDLNDVGVETPEDLLEADLEALFEESGIGLERLAGFAEEARAGLDEGESGPDASREDAAGDDLEASEAGETGDEVPDLEVEADDESGAGDRADEGDDVKVVLREGHGAASVRVGEDWHEELPIVTATVDEDPHRKLQQVAEDAVLLQEKQARGSVRIGDVTYQEVPLVRRREKEGGVVEETPVEVDSVREKTESRGLLDRVRGLLP